MRLEAGELVLRPFHPDDRLRLMELANNPNVARHLTKRFPHPYRLEDADAWIGLVREEERPCNFAVEWNRSLVGGIGLMPLSDVHDGTAEIGYWVGEPYWGKGIAAGAVGLLASHALDEMLFIRLQAAVFQGNRASMRVLEKNGLVREAILRKHIRKDGVIFDAVLYAKLRNP